MAEHRPLMTGNTYTTHNFPVQMWETSIITQGAYPIATAYARTEADSHPKLLEQNRKLRKALERLTEATAHAFGYGSPVSPDSRAMEYAKRILAETEAK